MINRMKDFISKNCVLTGVFSLSDGEKSEIYFDLKRALLDKDFLGWFIFHWNTKICPYAGKIDAIGAYGVGGALLLPILLHGGGHYYYDLKGMLIRNPKDHGTQNIIENNQSPGQRVLVVDDVLTTGKSINIACGLLEGAGHKVVDIFALLDRSDDKARKALSEKYGLPIKSLFKADDFK